MSSTLSSLAALPPAQRARFLRGASPQALLTLRAELTAAARAREAAERRAESLRDFIPRTTPAFRAPDHLAPLLRVFDRIRAGEAVRALVFAPPRHGKTEVILHGLAQCATTPGWERDLLGYVSYGAAFAAGKSLKARAYAGAAGFVAHPRKDSAEKWLSAAGGGLLATGIDGPVLGEGFRLLVVDDPHKNRVEAESPRLRAKVVEYWKGTLVQRLEPRASAIVTHQRWVEGDLLGTLKAEGGWELIELPALDAAGRPLWPERYGREDLAAIRRGNEYNWWSQYMGTPRPRGGAVFKAEPFRFEGAGKDGRRVVLSVDAAGTESTRSDFTVGLALAFAGAGAAQTCHVVDMVRARLEPQDAAKVLRDFQARHGGAPLVIEATRDGKALAAALRKIDARLRLHEVPPIGDKFVRAQPVASAWNDTAADGTPSPRVGVPADATAHPWVADLLAELRLFTGAGDKHDDIVDALSQGWNHAAVGAAPRAPAASVAVAPHGAWG